MLVPERFGLGAGLLQVFVVRHAREHRHRLPEGERGRHVMRRPCSRLRSTGRRISARPATVGRGMRAPHGMRTMDMNAVGSPSRAASMPKARAVSASAGWPSQPTAMQFARSSFALGNRAAGDLQQLANLADVLASSGRAVRRSADSWRSCTSAGRIVLLRPRTAASLRAGRGRAGTAQALSRSPHRRQSAAARNRASIPL